MASKNLMAFLTGGAGTLQQNMQQRQQQQGELMNMFIKAKVENMIKQTQMQENLKNIPALIQAMQAQQGSQGGLGQMLGQGQPQSQSPFYLKNLFASDIGDMLGMLNPTEQMNLAEKQQAQQYQNRLNQYQMARNIPAPSLNLVRAPQQQIRQSLQARGVRNLLSPEFGTKSEFTRDASGNWKQLTPRERTGTDLMTASKLRQEFINRPEVKEFVTVATNVRSMDSMLNSAIKGNVNNRVALDQALITMYNKLTDPNSVVRESEYARTPENLPLFNRFGGALDKLQKGGAGLTNQDRQTLVWGAKIIANERGKTFNTTYEDYNMLAREYGIKPDLVLRGMDKFTEYSSDTQGINQGQPQQQTQGRYGKYTFSVQ